MPSEMNPKHQQMFDSIAHRYELVNSIISLGLYRHWNKKFLSTILQTGRPRQMLDLCSGTGIVAASLFQKMQKKNISPPSLDCIDFSPEMIAAAQERLKPFHIQCICADALHLPIKDCFYDTISIAYGIRNLSPQKEALLEMVRVLQPGGVIHILELFQPKPLALSLLHKLYLRSIVPLVGCCVTGNLQPYKYLARSLDNYTLDGLLQNVETTGCVCESVTPLFCGAAAIITLRK
jgi:demethylmenaquinone methyltransferase/2-methoxy-6-polyprenyl-1,4-benzoquinol methylase